MIVAETDGKLNNLIKLLQKEPVTKVKIVNEWTDGRLLCFAAELTVKNGKTWYVEFWWVYYEMIAAAVYFNKCEAAARDFRSMLADQMQVTIES
jgi:hypothetical protein